MIGLGVCVDIGYDLNLHIDLSFGQERFYSWFNLQGVPINMGIQ